MFNLYLNLKEEKIKFVSVQGSFNPLFVIPYEAVQHVVCGFFF